MTTTGGLTDSFRCPYCLLSVPFSTTRNTINLTHRCINPSSSSPISISISGPHSQNTTLQSTLHNSDYVDSDDEDLFNSILERTTGTNDRYGVDGSNRSSSSTSNIFIRSLPVVKTPSVSSDSCSICKDELAFSNETVNVLPCKHLFHRDCIVLWLHRSNTCPLCRYQLPKEPKERPLMKYIVRIGDRRIEGWGVDYNSGFEDALLRDTLLSTPSSERRVVPVRPSSPSSTPILIRDVRVVGGVIRRMFRVRRTTSSLAREEVVMASDGDFNVNMNESIDEDGDTVMLDA